MCVTAIYALDLHKVDGMVPTTCPRLLIPASPSLSVAQSSQVHHARCRRCIGRHDTVSIRIRPTDELPRIVDAVGMLQLPIPCRSVAEQFQPAIRAPSKGSQLLSSHNSDRRLGCCC